jgi:hypothetical protein
MIRSCPSIQASLHSRVTLAAAALLASRVDTHAVVRIVLGLTLVSCVILFIQYHWLLTFYDRMGYPRLRLRSPADLEKYYAETESDGEYFRRRRKLRRVGDRLLFVFAFAEIILLGYAATRTIYPGDAASREIAYDPLHECLPSTRCLR